MTPDKALKILEEVKALLAAQELPDIKDKEPEHLDVVIHLPSKNINIVLRDYQTEDLFHWYLVDYPTLSNFYNLHSYIGSITKEEIQRAYKNGLYKYLGKAQFIMPTIPQS